jgi:hypothetical protein
LTPAEREAYTAFLSAARARATFFSSGPDLYPALWIAPLSAE